MKSPTKCAAWRALSLSTGSRNSDRQKRSCLLFFGLDDALVKGDATRALLGGAWSLFASPPPVFRQQQGPIREIQITLTHRHQVIRVRGEIWTHPTDDDVQSNIFLFPSNCAEIDSPLGFTIHQSDYILAYHPWCYVSVLGKSFNINNSSPRKHDLQISLPTAHTTHAMDQWTKRIDDDYFLLVSIIRKHELTHPHSRPTVQMECLQCALSSWLAVKARLPLVGSRRG